jgi:hypothetical protein
MAPSVNKTLASMVPTEFELPISEEVFELMRTVADGPAKTILEAATALAKVRGQNVIETADFHDTLASLCESIEDGLHAHVVDQDKLTTARKTLDYFRGLINLGVKSGPHPAQ